MSPSTIDLTTPRGTMPVHLNRPDGEGPFPLIILFMDAPGIRPALHAHAERLVAAGYATALPDLYYAFDAADLPDVERLRAGDPAALLHPSRLVTDEPDSPHLGVERVRATLYLGYGENDHVTPVSTIPPLRERLEADGVTHTIEIIPGADHGFTMPGMPAYSETAAETAWTGTLAVLGEHLSRVR